MDERKDGGREGGMDIDRICLVVLFFSRRKTGVCSMNLVQGRRVRCGGYV